MKAIWMFFIEIIGNFIDGGDKYFVKNIKPLPLNEHSGGSHWECRSDEVIQRLNYIHLRKCCECYKHSCIKSKVPIFMIPKLRRWTKGRESGK